MCFSAAASFTVAAVLLPASAYCIETARRIGPNWLAFAIIPLAFSIQQAIEGLVWLSISASDQSNLAITSRGYLFFSHFFWLAWIPLSVYLLERDPWRRKLLLILMALGVVAGLSIFLPSLLISDWLSVELAHNSLNYKAVLIYDGIASRTLLRGSYALFIVSILFLSSLSRVRIFGGLIVAALLVTNLFFAHAIISVWCFLAAVLSTYIVMVMMIERHRLLQSE